MVLYTGTKRKAGEINKWRVGETVNSHAFHACIHGFESRTRHHVNYISHTRKCSCMIFFYYLIGMKNDGDHNLEKIKS